MITDEQIETVTGYADGADRVRQAVDRIRDIVDERLALLENDELDDA